MRVHFIIPSNNPKIMISNMLPSLKFFEPVKDLVSFGLVLQKYSQEEVSQVVAEFQKHGIQLFYIEKEYVFERGYTPLVEMRDDAAMLNPTAEFYGLLDDDNVFADDGDFLISDVIKDSLTYFDKYPDCGTIIVSNGKPLGVITPNTRQFQVCTNLAMFIRNIYEDGHILPKHLCKLFGMNEDALVGKQRILDGYFDAVCVSNCGHHTDIKELNNSGWFKHDWNIAKTRPGSVNEYLQTTLLGKYYNFFKMKKDNKFPEDFICKKK